MAGVACALRAKRDDGVGVLPARRDLHGEFYRWRRLLGEADIGDRLIRPADHSPGFVDLGALSSTGADRLELTLDLGGGLVLHLVRG